jgi:hypothetical protein
MSSSEENSQENKDRKDLNQFDVGASASKKVASGKGDSAKPVVEASMKKGVSAAASKASAASVASASSGSELDPSEAQEQSQEPTRRRSGFWNAAPSWLISTVTSWQRVRCP